MTAFGKGGRGHRERRARGDRSGSRTRRRRRGDDDAHRRSRGREHRDALSILLPPRRDLQRAARPRVRTRSRPRRRHLVERQPRTKPARDGDGRRQKLAATYAACPGLHRMLAIEGLRVAKAERVHAFDLRVIGIIRHFLSATRAPVRRKNLEAAAFVAYQSVRATMLASLLERPPGLGHEEP